MTMNSSEKKLTHKDLMGIFWRSFRQDAVWNFERQQNLGSAYTMSRVVGKLYEDDKEKRARALQRHVDLQSHHIYQHCCMESWRQWKKKMQIIVTLMKVQSVQFVLH